MKPILSHLIATTESSMEHLINLYGDCPSIIIKSNNVKLPPLFYTKFYWLCHHNPFRSGTVRISLTIIITCLKGEGGMESEKVHFDVYSRTGH